MSLQPTPHPEAKKLTEADYPDFLLLDADLPADVIELRDRIRAFGRDVVFDVIDEYWERAEFPPEVVKGLAELGIAGGQISGYGCPGHSELAMGIVARELAMIDGSVNTFFGVHSGLGMGAIHTLGDEEQRQRWLPAMARFEKTGAFGLTEPYHGSDSVSLETSAHREGDEWVLNGHKRWIGNGHQGDVIVVFARGEADGQVKAFVVEKRGDGSYPEGYRPTAIEGKFGKRAIQQADIEIEDLRIPETNRLQNCNSFKDVNKVLGATRGGVAWEACGHGVAAFAVARQYALDRTQFGAPIAGYQLVQEKLATMLAGVTQNELLCRRMIELIDRGEFTHAMASMMKMQTVRNSLEVCRIGRDMMGGNGVLLENRVARHLSDMEVVATYEGTDSMQALILGREITGVSAFTNVKR
ncbi:acyl-CoA dehydrogenase family protein [Corynebacterium frankenforstense]|uniref:acyl-CoA dehydrogenase family protein n=1 Tax=Corynebacterium frankenforstense TaxID=1230998 RepID=UPI0026F23AF1|nr:acyl-CoA dehydrogenase family protein [Corynebacterium frankenforstense]